MRLAVLGTGIVGKTLADKLSALGHNVMIGTRDPAASRARTAPDTFGGPPLSAFLAEHPGVALGTLADAASAKAKVTGILHEWFGWQDVIDLGGIAMSRGTEMYLPLWARLYRALQNPMFTIKVVR